MKESGLQTVSFSIIKFNRIKDGWLDPFMIKQPYFNS